MTAVRHGGPGPHCGAAPSLLKVPLPLLHVTCGAGGLAMLRVASPAGSAPGGDRRRGSFTFIPPVGVGLMCSGCRLPAPRVERVREPGPGRLLVHQVPWAGLSRPLDFPCNVRGFRLYSVGIRKGCLFHSRSRGCPQPAHRCQCPLVSSSPPRHPLGEHRPLPLRSQA